MGIMEINTNNIRKSMISLKSSLKEFDEELEDLLKLQHYSENDILKVFDYLTGKLLDINYTSKIATYFKSNLLMLVTSIMPMDEVESNFVVYQRKTIALAILANTSKEILRYAKRYLANKPAPFDSSSEQFPTKKKIKTNLQNITDLQLVKGCYILLKCDPIYFKDLWDWSIFLEKYVNQGCAMQQLYTNHIVGMLTNMTPIQLKQLNGNIPDDILVKFDLEITNKDTVTSLEEEIQSGENIKINWHFSEEVVNIEGVLLPVYNKENAKTFNISERKHEQIVKVDSTKMNLRSIALGISSGKAICLSGPVGCGKTTLVEYLAQITGRIAPKQTEVDKQTRGLSDKRVLKERKTNTVPIVNSNGKRKSMNKTEDSGILSFNNLDNQNGFLRIQLGDQTDSKMLLGQYRCTDVPGEFIWSPGVLTQAVLNGNWLLLEDLDSATQDTYTILSNLLENNFLSVPGFRDCIKIEPGFQLFATVRTNKNKNNSQKTILSLLEKYMYTVNILPLSRKELCEIVSVNYPKLSTIANRIVDVYLTFSSGDHVGEDRLRHIEDENSNETKKNEYVALPFEKVSISTLPNSGRLVSTRDLMKLCQRSNPMFSVTSTECAYFVFQNAADVFCSYLPQSLEKTKLIVSIGAKIGIIQSRCEFFSDEYKPEVQVLDDSIKVGRAQLYIKSLNESNSKQKQSSNNESVPESKRIKLNDDTTALTNFKERAVTFSFTRMTSCLLEKIAVCVTQKEPILLVGETGVGKTSSVQYLAQKTHHKLVVVNMNNQSDVSDLVGGFKPVDLSYVMAPLRTDFEILFRKTFNEMKNEKFLSNISICYNQGNFTVLIKAMLKIVGTVFERVKRGELEIKENSKYIGKWRELQVKLLKLNSQLEKSINVSFAFIPGSLVNCIKNGDWVLLDEINLASAETLECLSTILEPEGSVVLLEKGDFTPIKRHPDFRIFACMNPNTDVGKKDLPTGIRNRFTEFFVDELTNESDLMLLVSDYLNNTGIKKPKVYNIVKLYKKLKSLSQLELNDGLGNRPVYSLRTLCRALTICAKNLCGSIERNLFESFCLSFLTQLDPVSHKAVLDLIKSALISDVKSILSQSIPKPGENYINFEGYWIKTGPKEILECESYILTESVRQNLKDLARIISIGKLPILLQGPTSAGKTSLIEYVAKRSGNHYLRINNHEHTDLQEYVGTYVSDSSGKLSFKEGVLAQAMRNGFWIILDELNLASTDILEALNRVLDDNRELFIPETQTVIKAHPNFMLFATQNPPGLYGGRKTLSRAFKNRFIELHFSEIPRAELEVILEKRCFIPKSYAQKMVKCMSDLQVNRKTTTRNNFTLRDLFRWGNRYTYADKNLLANNLYDWNQHLVDEGYLVLSAKVRSEIEVTIIEETLYKNFRKKISFENLFSLNENTSMVTKHILDKLQNYKKRSDIVWTQNMTRMAVLTAKALEFSEPVLLVGPTGCGKTTICQILSEINNTHLRILNCHMHTEGADFLGGLRPCRSSDETDPKKKKLFEWSDGPLVISMQNGNYFMADEISLAEDSVLERLNSVLEPERTLLLSEKGGISTNSESEVLSAVNNDFIVYSHKGFQFLATMNPGGDFGKKELSPALRNRFTEIWCRASDAADDLIRIASNTLKLKFPAKNDDELYKIANVLVNVVFHLKANVEKFKFSVRDILAWANYITENLQNPELSLAEIIIFGLETIFLDSLEMLSHESLENVEKCKDSVIRFTLSQIRSLEINVTKNDIQLKRGSTVEYQSNKFGIKPFFIETNRGSVERNQNFLFEAPTTQKNLFRLLSALSLRKAILLEGPPGVGKTSIVENIAHAIGYKIVRINLCEHTDLADLFGTDLPAEEKALEISPFESDAKEVSNLGSFTWRDGPLLAALKSQNTWILLDELNLAPQSVLEGLNAILDHRGEVFIPELNKTFVLGQKTRIFACQNPLRQGGGRKGLPQSFLNRFTKVYLRKLNTDDLLFVVNKKYSGYFQELQSYFENLFKYAQTDTENPNLFDVMSSRNILTQTTDNCKCSVEFDLSARMVKFSEILDKGISDLEFGHKGGPFEINLRDILRWCDLLVNPNTGFLVHKNVPENKNGLENLFKNFDNFLLTLYERMKLVYYQRMRSEADKSFVRNAFSTVFSCNAEKLNKLSEDIGLYWTPYAIYLNDIVITRDTVNNFDDSYENIHYHSIPPMKTKSSYPLLLSSQREILKNVAECVHMEKPVILCGPTDSGKTKIVDVLCSLSNQLCNFDTIDDSVTGSYQQIDLNRHLEEVSQNVELLFTLLAQKLILKTHGKKRAKDFRDLIDLFKLWKTYTILTTARNGIEQSPGMSDELVLFKERINKLHDVITKIIHTEKSPLYQNTLKNLQAVLLALENVIKNAESLNTGGHFEWVDSKIVKSLKLGQYICLEHVNLCSAAILDRLNPVFEPNGNLLISEKGIMAGDDAEIVEKHKNFRAFLTIDPKNGELSRAMRNRCVELCLTNDYYNLNDSKALIYKSGIEEVYLINILLNIHEKIRELTDLSNFTISHLMQFSFLTASYKKMGYDDKKALYTSGMEVYVYPSNVDLLGYGLLYYQEKIQEILKNEINNLSRKDYVFSLENVILTCDNLNTMSMIKMCCEPLNIMLKSVSAEYSEELNHLKKLEYDNYFNLIELYVCLLYESSSFDDLTQRNEYIKSLLDNATKLSKSEIELLVEMNNKILKEIRNAENQFKSSNRSLPWNRNLFHRIRTYNENKQTRNELYLSALLFAHTLVKCIENQQITKLNKISALGYSQAVSSNRIGDSLNNMFLKNLSDFLRNLSPLLMSVLNDVQINTEEYVVLLTSILWINRMQEISKQKLFNDKVLNKDLIDKLLLHYKWIKKHLLKLFEHVCPNYKQLNMNFNSTAQKVDDYAQSVSLPLNVIKKYYFKVATNFKPFYSDQQIALSLLHREFKELTTLVPHLGSFSIDTVIQRLSAVLSDDSEKIKQLIIRKELPEYLKYVQYGCETEMDFSRNVPEEIKNYLQDFIANFQQEVNDINSEDDFILEDIQISLSKLKEICNSDDYVIDMQQNRMEIFSLPEYFATKSLSKWTYKDTALNKDYFEEICSFGINNRVLVHIFASDQYKRFAKLYSGVLDYLNITKNIDEFEELLKCMSSNCYRNISTFHRIITSILQGHRLNSLSVRRDVLEVLRFKDDLSAESIFNGPPLTSIMVSLGFQFDGKLRPIALSEFNDWKNSLSSMKQLLWNNSNITATEEQDSLKELRNTVLKSNKLILEVDYVQKLCNSTENEIFVDYNTNFQKLLDKLKEQQIVALEILQESNSKDHPSMRIYNYSFYTSLLNSLIGCIEVCLLSFTPLIDPVQKNRLKNEYIREDLNCLKTIRSAYDIMKITLNYENYAAEIYDGLENRIAHLDEKKNKLHKQLALRPQTCLYSGLVQDVNHFIQTNCDPKSLLSLIEAAEMCWKKKLNADRLDVVTDTKKKLYLWIVNSQRFLHHTLKIYSSYYNDFVQPIECAIKMIKFGFAGLKTSLEQKQNFISIFGVEFDEIVPATLSNVMEFPSVQDLVIFDKVSKTKCLDSKSKIFNVLDKIEHSDLMYYGLLKAKLLEIKNKLVISGEIDDEAFSELDCVFNILNQMWQEQEERMKKQKIEEESLYVTRTKGHVDDEEELELLEVQENFPTFVEEDFGQFIQQDTLEKVIKLSKTENISKKMLNIMTNEEFKLLGENFIEIMENYSRLYYLNTVREKSSAKSVNFTIPFKNRMEAFVKLFNKYKPCLNEWMDEKLYNSFGFVVGLQQDSLNQITITQCTNNELYNFYKDSNISEIITCTEILSQIESRTKEQLALYPDHAVLNDIIQIIKKIRSLPVTSAVVRFNTGFQILRHKISQWNEVAHKNNHMRDLEARVAEFVQRWTKLELQFWRTCLIQTYDKVESNAYKYWFFIYNLIHEYLKGSESDSFYVDFQNVEKQFEDKEHIHEGSEKATIQTSQVVNVLRQFVEASNYADFFTRMKLLRSFEIYLHYVNIENNERRDKLISIIHNLQIYFEQFSLEIDETIKSMRSPIEKKLREFVKIESYNKDLSYFSMRNNVARVHRNLNKFLKEYENLLKTKIAKVFQQKENPSSEYNLDNDKGINLRYETKIKYYMIDVKNFIAPQKLKDQYSLISDDDSTSALLKRVDKFFVTSRNVVKQAILHSNYPSLIYIMDLLLTDQVETCDYMRKLEVDRTQEREKQKSQAKNILQQKRKALSDLYKTLTNLGISYKTGLMELSMETELIDNEIAPFCVKNMFKISKNKKLDQNLIYLSENLDNYYAKCVFKLKLLKNIMLTPNSELGPLNTDRMKGFSVDMFLLVQNQRKMLSKSIKEIYDLRNMILNVITLLDSSKTVEFNDKKLNFEQADQDIKIIKTCLCKTQNVLEQFILVMKCAPEKTDEKSVVLEGSHLAISQESDCYIKAIQKTNKILHRVKDMLAEIFTLNKFEFVGLNKTIQLRNSFKSIVTDIISVKDLFKIESGLYLPIVKPLENLIEHVNEIEGTCNSLKTVNEPLDTEKLDTELENIIHSILLSIQKLFKKYSEKEPEEENLSRNTSPNKRDDEEEQPIQDNHLREKIYKEICNDLEILNVSNILKKLSNILLAMKYTNFPKKCDYIKKVASIIPILEQFNLIGDYFLFQQLGAHKVAAKMLSIMLTVFIELGTKGFCIPPDLMQDEEGGTQKEEKKGDGFGFEDGTGENDVSDKIESEDQLDDAKRPEDREGKDEEKNENCKEEKGIDMSENFDGEMQDVDKPEDDEDNEEPEEEEEMDKEMGKTEEGAEKLDDQIWGSDEENENSEDEEELSDEENGKGSKESDDKHNNLDSKNETTEQGDDEQQEGLDATDENNSNKDKKKQQKEDIDEMKDQEMDEEQVNPYHNELEEPPEAEDMDLGDNCNIEEENANDDNEQHENPFDIDKMKENMIETEEEEENQDNDDNNEDDKEKHSDDDGSESEPEPEAGTKRDETQEEENVIEEDKNEEETDETRGNIDDNNENEEMEEKAENEEKKDQTNTDDYQQSKDKATKEDNVQSVPDEKQKGSDDQIENNENQKDVQQDQELDNQDTGEEKEGVGVAENDVSERGHQGIAETKETKSSEKEENKTNKNEKRKQRNTNEERTLGEADKNSVKQLKTVDTLKDIPNKEDENEKDVEAEEYQHVKEPKKSDKITLDSATEEQSKQIQHLEDENDINNEEENNDDLMEVDENEENEDDLENLPKIEAEPTENKSEKPSKSEKTKEKCETSEPMEVEGDTIETFTVPRSNDTTAHCIKDVLLDTSVSQELSTLETLELKKSYQNQMLENKAILPRHEDYEEWQLISSKMLPNARELCEQLRLILEPTKCTRLKGDYRTGRRINMKKIIPYIASQFRKDKIWLRRTKPAQRDYKITIAIDDSKSMHHNNSKSLTLQAISLISQALTLLESGKLSIISFGEAPEVILNSSEQFDGPKLVRSLNFAQNQSKIAELLNFVRIASSEEGSSNTDLFENLLLVLSDGRNIYSEGEQKVRNAIKLARLQRIFLVYIIIDNPENKHSILDIRVPSFSADKKSIAMKSYLDVFPFPYYVIVRDLGQLPTILSEAMRQWFELVNSEQ